MLMPYRVILQYFYSRALLYIYFSVACRSFVWPLFTLSHHLVVWYCAETVRPSLHYTDYPVLGDDVIITKKDVATMYKRVLIISIHTFTVVKSGYESYALFIFLTHVSYLILQDFFNTFKL